jgi:predicted acylesterase/phospholipase RssA
VTQLANPELFKDGVNLTLGGGGAKGFVHLGVVEELAEIGIPIKAIVGTSIGAVIGALFAYFSTSLFRNDERPQLAASRAVTDLFLRENFWQYRDVSLLSGFTKGLLKGDKISKWLADKLYDEEQSRSIRFDELQFPLTITATDAHTGECLVINAERERARCLCIERSAQACQFSGPLERLSLKLAGRPTGAGTVEQQGIADLILQIVSTQDVLLSRHL